MDVGSALGIQAALSSWGGEHVWSSSSHPSLEEKAVCSEDGVGGAEVGGGVAGTEAEEAAGPGLSRMVPYCLVLKQHLYLSPVHVMGGGTRRHPQSCFPSLCALCRVVLCLAPLPSALPMPPSQIRTHPATLEKRTKPMSRTDQRGKEVFVRCDLRICKSV